MSENTAALSIESQKNSMQQPAKCPEIITEWVETKVLADLADISDRAARMAAVTCLSGGTWRGATLLVRYEGRAILIYGPSLPPDLRDIWRKRYGISQTAENSEALKLTEPDAHAARVAADYTLRRWKAELIAPALKYPKGSRERGQALKEAAGKEYKKPNGKLCKPGLSTLQDWIRAIEREGEQALARKPRADQAKPRVLVSRAWDAACTLPEGRKAEIAEKITEHVKSLWLECTPGWNRINQLASAELHDLCRAAGWDGATVENCVPGRAFVEKFRALGLVGLKKKNAKRFFDKFNPRIHRNRENYKPGDIVIGDVHPLDVQRNEDGRIVHARLISWLDLATYDLFVTIVILPPGRGIRQEDIAASFVDMVQAWGLPRQLRLDNGAEYKWDAMIEGFHMLAGLVSAFDAFHVSILNSGDAAEMIDDEQFDPERPVSRARPYNAPAKQIESVFGIIEYHFFSMIPGWVGGDRMNKRTHQVGEAPRAHEGSDEEFARDLGTCLALYRNTPQRDGSSPNDKRRAFIAKGWKRVSIGRNSLMFAFSEVRKFTVHPGGINVDNQWYIADVLIPLIGQRIEIRVAKWAREQVLYIDKAHKLHAVPLAKLYGQEDGEGAREQARLAGLQNLYMRQLKAGTKKIDLLKEAARYNALLPPPPELPEGRQIETTEGARIAEALENASAPVVLRLQPGQLQNPENGEVLTLRGTPDTEESKPTAIDFDPLKFSPPTTEKPRTNPDELEFDLIKALAVSHHANRKD